MSSPSVIVRVPASTANLGPGFDTLGIALQLHNHVRVTRTPTAGINLTSPIANDARSGALAVIEEAASLFFRRIRQRPFGFDIHLSGDVPIARGLGSSVTVRLGVVAALDALAETGLSRQDLFQQVTELEGHPDNAAPATFGGFTAATLVGREARCLRLRVDPRLTFVTLIPPFEVSTKAARERVPDAFSRADAVHNLTRVSLITAAFALRAHESLRGLFDDRLHQPYREPLIPQLPRVLRAGERAGALGGWLSGSGSTIICLTLDRPEAVARAMARQIPGSTTRLLEADPRGYLVSRARRLPAAR